VSTQGERQLSDLLHRITPEPPRQVTTEDVATRLADEAARGHRRRANREPRIRRGRTGRGRRWVPALAAAGVVAVAAASVGVATLLSSHNGSASPTGGVPGTTASATPTSASASPSASASATSKAPQQRQTKHPTRPLRPLAGAPWSAELINPDEVAQDSLAGGASSLYVVASGRLDRIDPATGNVLRSAPYPSPLPVTGPPVAVGNTVWAVWSYAAGSVVLHGYDGTTMAQTASFSVPVTGQLSAAAQGVLTAGPDGNLYLAAGSSIAVVSPSSGQVVRRVAVAGPASSVAVSPDGSKLYVSTYAAAGQTFSLLVYHLPAGTQVASSSVSIGGGGNLVATSGGVWGTVGAGMSEWTWFAPDGNLSRWVRETSGAGGGLESVPTFSGGTVWIGGSRTLACADPATGKILASAPIPGNGGVVEYFGRVVVVGGHVYSDYQNEQAQRFGVVRMTPPAACG
jgi:hypothetical protein